MPRALVTLEQAAQLVGRPRSTVLRWLEAGELHGAERTEEGWRVPRQTVVARARRRDPVEPGPSTQIEKGQEASA